MEFYVMAKSYSCYGGHTTLSSIGDFLLKGARDFGDAIRELTVRLHFRDSGPPKKTLEQLLERHNSYRSTLPKITYRKANGKVEIDIASELMDGRDWKPSPRLSLPLFQRGVDEVIQALSLLKKRLKDSDAFDLEAFLAHCEAARQRVPGSEDALQDLAAELKAANQAKRDAMSPWEKLGIDWEDFHPRAQDILDHPFFWDRADDFSPNGNDTGADLLESYRDWLKRHADGQPIRFLECLAKQWGYEDIEGMDDEVRDEAVIGLAFADIKLRAICDQRARRLALEAIERQRNRAEAATDWSHRNERLKTLEKIQAKLQQTG
ncbi:MAG: hypothetical protein WCD63_12970 [Terrimicrobiaceae bacterium]